MKKCILLLSVLSFVIVSYAKEETYETYSQNSPEQVVRAFVELDGLNLLYNGVGWAIVEVLTEWKDAPGWDEVHLVNDYSIRTVLKARDTAIVEVTYEVAGRLSSAGQYERGEAREIIMMKLRRNSGGVWKIYDPLPFPPHLFSKYCVDEKDKKCTKHNYESKAK